MGSSASRAMVLTTNLLKQVMSASSKIVKSKSDSKDYRVITLKNGLKALLISDLKGVDIDEECILSCTNGNLSDSESDVGSESEYESCSEEEMSVDEDNELSNKSHGKRKKKQAAAALCINVGSFSDPDNVPGLAHFLEHMVFMGSDKYPNENKFDSFVSKYGGSDNAHTDTERTVFLFEIQPEYFAKALDIWAQFFVAPLMKFDSIKREVKAVDAEFDMSLNADRVRKEQLIGNYLFSKGHPMGKFMWGNKKSLYDTPAQNGIDVYGALKNFHKKYYLANYMTLAVQSPEELDTLENWVQSIFEEIPCGSENVPESYSGNIDVVPFHVLKIIPVKNIQEIHLVWILPPQQKYYRTKPLHYLSWLVGHEGKGSILSLLKEKKLAFSLSGGNEGCGFDHNRTCSLFHINVILTDEGLSKYCEVVDIIFQYLAMLQQEGASERVFNEIQKIEDIDFAFGEEESPLENVESLCENVLLYPEEHIVSGDDLLFEYDAECINNALNALKPETCAILLSAPSFKSLKDTSKEQWFGTRYCSTCVPEDWQTKWKEGFGKDGIHQNLHLPAPNLFIAENFELQCGLNSVGSSVDKYPIFISTPNCGYKLWFRQDDIFKLPKAFIRIHLINPLSLQTPHNTVYLEILVHLLVHNLAEVAYDADAASMTYGAEVGEDGGLILKFRGFNDKLGKLVDTVACYLADFNTTEQDFNQRLLQHRRNYFNTLIKPAKLAKMLRLTILRRFAWSSVDKYNACENLTYDGFLNFVGTFFASLYIEALVQGNYAEEEVNSIISKFCEKMKCNALSEDRIRKQRIIKLQQPSSICKVSSINRSDQNSMVVAFFQGDPYSVKDGSLIRLLEAVMEEPCFDILRTKQQLGYTVYVQHHLTGGILGLSINVATQTGKFSVEETTKRIVDFATKKMGDVVKKMTAKEFDAHLQSLIAVLRNDDTHLGEEVGRNWAEVLCRKYRFDRIQKEIDYLETCTQSEFKKFYAKMCSNNKRILHIQVEGCLESNNIKSNSMEGCDNDDSANLRPITLQFLQSHEPGHHYVTSIENMKNSSSYFEVASD